MSLSCLPRDRRVYSPIQSRCHHVQPPRRNPPAGLGGRSGWPPSVGGLVVNETQNAQRPLDRCFRSWWCSGPPTSPLPPPPRPLLVGLGRHRVQPPPTIPTLPDITNGSRPTRRGWWARDPSMGGREAGERNCRLRAAVALRGHPPLCSMKASMGRGSRFVKMGTAALVNEPLNPASIVGPLSHPCASPLSPRSPNDPGTETRRGW